MKMLGVRIAQITIFAGTILPGALIASLRFSESKKEELPMIRALAVAAMFALLTPTLAIAQHEEEHHQGVPPHPGGPPHPAPAARPFIAPRGPPPGARPAFVPHGPPGAQFSYRGRTINRVHIIPFIYPNGWAYRRWAVGAALPPLFLVRDYWYPDWAALGLEPPPPGAQWVRYGPDLLLVDVSSGQVIDVAYGVFY
jgi:Nickel/cobalt transporter regulator